ncbi:hypothetical protein CKF59_00375 [Psittacicella gerlachiana]|uniref:S-adenosylmethionine:tRNA ribosyltransferase-isomerase n=2 Tax=Psittacicella gerlachiana TaxID=2028574 RepID=A0A3A1YML6_9GAMM|nr:hypothetical protein CKF59_00375 [Psittacicella gerlachiana]
MVQFSINQYINSLDQDLASTQEIKLRRQNLVYRDLLDKISLKRIKELNQEAQIKELIAPREICHTINSLNLDTFSQLTLELDNHLTLITELWQFLQNLTQIDTSKFSATNQETLALIRHLTAEENNKNYSFTNHYINTSCELGTQIPLLPYTGNTEIFIHPGHKVHLVDYIITNFHLPKSTLIMLVAGFVGFKYCLSAYEHAIAHKYRFYSYGDSCFIPNLKQPQDLELLF